MRTMYRQGDVLLVVSLKTPTPQAKAVTDRGRVILAYGEVTGHAHEVVPIADNRDDVPAMELFEEPDGTRLLVVRRAVELRHEEHGRIALAPDVTYEVRRQVEYTPAEIRTVSD
jgi:hypothetical protein